MSSSEIINDSITPFVQRILADPLVFKPARHSETVTYSPVSYIRVGPTTHPVDTSTLRATDSTASPEPEPLEKKSTSRIMPKITSLAQAIAGYTNKRTLVEPVNGQKSKKAKTLLKHETSETNVEEEEDDTGESLEMNENDEDNELNAESTDQSSSSDEDDDTNYQDACSLVTETPRNIISRKVFQQFDSKTSTSDSNNDENEEEDEDEEDGDYTETSQDGSEDSDENDESDEIDAIKKSDSDKDFDKEDGGSTQDSSDTKSDSRSADEVSDMDEVQLLKKDLLEDQRNPVPSLTTPPTSPDSEDDKEPTPQPQIMSKLDKFYQFNENQYDKGSNDSKVIVKNWGSTLTKLKPLGLLNHGVTCYTNAAVQAMIHIPAVQHYLFDILKSKYKDTISPRSVSHVLAEISTRMWNTDNLKKRQRSEGNSETGHSGGNTWKTKFIDPAKLIGRLDDINCMMSEWQQEDSHEYFMSLLSRLQEDSTPKGHKLNESIIYDIFGGLLDQSVTCKSCGHVSKTNQEFYDLSVHLGNSRKNSQVANENKLPEEEEIKQIYSIQKSIRDFFSPELIKTDKSDKSGYVCENCEKRTNAVKISSISRAPETLIVHLKRFRFNGSSSSKVKQGVSYPAMLDLSQYTTNGSDNVLYQLISVVVHEGRSVSSGHYIAHCRQPDGSWATYDDEYINTITEKQALRDPSAYYLIYTRLTHKEHNLRPDDSIVTSSPLPTVPSTHSTKPLKSKAYKKMKASISSPSNPNKRMNLNGHQPTNNLSSIGRDKKTQKKYSKRPKFQGSRRFKKY